ncbi:MAG: RNA 3'-terminal phosphate cyclase [Myxococcota bacterium]|jgi:RNA 3'-terminal phosphate cyclase (ATP)|nr:RNA 3'-terminal phosphate cyclase [Myxococcota bacterium]
MSLSLRELLNRARWRDGALHALELVVVHRGAPSDRRVVSGARVTEVGAGGVTIAPERDDEDETFLPYHRFLAVRGADGALWDKELGVLASVDAPSATGAASTIADEPEGREIAVRHEVVLRNASAQSPLVIDGSAGEGGGQILRTSLTLSMLTGRPFAIDRIRGKRKKGGLLRQHLTCVNAAAAICGGKVDGATLGSPKLTFRPGPLRGVEKSFDIGSAGSVALVLQTIALPLAFADGPSTITIRGGTHAAWAPIVPFLEHAWLPRVRAMGAELAIELRKTGFYPAGGGELVLHVTPTSAMDVGDAGDLLEGKALAPLHLSAPRGALILEAHAIVSDVPESVARRELSALAEQLDDERIVLRSATVRSVGPGNALWLVARDEDGSTNVFSALGERGVSAEDVAREVAQRFVAWRASGAAVEEHLTDQLLVPIALAGAGRFTTDVLSLHTTTNVDVIEAFTERRIRSFDLGDGRFRVML